MYVADLEISKGAKEKADVPLHSIPDCEYMFYGMFLNCAAFMNGTKNARLVLIHSCTGELIEYRYKPQMAEELLDHYLANFSEEEAQIQIHLDLEIEQVKLDL